MAVGPGANFSSNPVPATRRSDNHGMTWQRILTLVIAVALGAGAAVLGHPAAAIAMLANHLGRRGQEIPAGSLILSGGVTEAVVVNAGDNVTLRVQGMGSVSLCFA